MGPTAFYGARAEKTQKADFAMKQTNTCRLSGDIKITATASHMSLLSILESSSFSKTAAAHRTRLFSDTNISQGSVATRLRCGGIFNTRNDCCIALQIFWGL